MSLPSPGKFFEFLLIWLLVAAVAYVYFGQLFPKTPFGITLFVVLGPPLYLAAELISDWLVPARDVEPRAYPPGFLRRLLVGLGLGALLVSLALLVTHIVVAG